MTETWKPIPELEGWYDVSNLGNVRSWHTPGHYRPPKRNDKPKTLKFDPHQKSGHLRVRIRKLILVHKLVMLTFVGPCPDGLEICHNNGKAWDNRLENLRYDTRRNNQLDRIKHGTLKFGENNPFAKLTEKEIKEIRHIYVKGQKPSQYDLAREYGVSRSNISKILLGNSWKTI